MFKLIKKLGDFINDNPEIVDPFICITAVSVIIAIGGTAIAYFMNAI